MSGAGVPFKFHYGSPVSRARALYRIPTAPNTNRTLELYHAREPLLADFAWPGAGSISCRLDTDDPSGNPAAQAHVSGDLRRANYQTPLPFAAASFDLVILHRTLDELAVSSRQNGSTFSAQALLKDIARVLVPGGLVAGCVDNRTGLKSVVRSAKHLLNRSAGKLPLAHFTLRSVRDLLVATNLAEVRTFSLLPNCASPLRLVDADATLSRIAFRHELQVARHSWSAVGYLVRRCVVELGLFPILEESIFFWAYKRC